MGVTALNLLVLASFMGGVLSQAQLYTIGTIGQKTFFDQKQNTLIQWKEAEAFCRDKSLTLATINNDDENDLVGDYLATLAGQRDYPIRGWLGGSDERSPGQWYWADSGNGLTYTNWGKFQPRKSRYIKQFNCMYMTPRAYRGDSLHHGVWKAHYCHIPYARAICQSESDPTSNGGPS